MLTTAPVNGQNDGGLHGSFNKELQGLGIKYNAIAVNFIVCSIMWDVSPVIFIFKHIFDIPPEKLWQTILREMGGKYATLSMIPEDLSLN